MVEMDKSFVFIVLGLITYVGNISAGYRLDEQVLFPNKSKHIVVLSKKYKKFFLFKNKKNRKYFFRAAVIQQLFGYFQLLFAIVLYYTPNSELSVKLFFIVLGLEFTYTIAVGIYYKLLINTNNDTKKK